MIAKNATEMGMILSDTDGALTAIPPTALVIDTAGVKTPSAMVRLDPKRV